MVNTLTLNPAIDRVLYLGGLNKNVTNRLDGAQDVIGGKGTHVSLNLKLLGMDSRAFGIAWGERGRRIMGILQESGIQVEFIHRETGNSRTNYLLVEDNNDCTILAEKGVLLQPEDIHEVLELLFGHVQPGDSLILSGDASNSPDPLVYNTIMDALRAKDLRVFLDTSGASLCGGVRGRPFLIKPNLDELSSLCGRSVGSEVSDVLAALKTLEPLDIAVIAVTMGAAGSIVKCPDGIYRAHPLAVAVRNTIGCGDSFLAGLAYGLEVGLPMADTVRMATAISSATAESALSVGFDTTRADELLAQCRVVQIG